VIIFNEGQPGRTALTTGTLGRIFTIPVIGLSYADGAALHQQATAGPVTATVTTSTESDPNAVTKNVIATSDRGNADEKVIVGAHLDSVVEGPGINDNGSGTSQNLEIAEEISALDIRPRRQLVFAFWGAEESGVLGSEHYVESLSPDEVGRIYANLNFDMTASPNYVRFVYDGDGSDTPVAGPARLRRDRVAVHGVLRIAGSGVGADGVQRPVRLRSVHRRRHPGRRPVRGRRGDQDG
jgi:Zn-dependent M28 family amino/carboxypeptidase